VINNYIIYCGLSKNGQGLVRTDGLLAYYNILFTVTSLFITIFWLLDTWNSRWIHRIYIPFKSNTLIRMNSILIIIILCLNKSTQITAHIIIIKAIISEIVSAQKWFFGKTVSMCSLNRYQFLVLFSILQAIYYFVESTDICTYVQVV